MAEISGKLVDYRRGIGKRLARVWVNFAHIPFLGWLFGMLAAAVLEELVGTFLARALGMSKIPALFAVNSTVFFSP